MKQQQKKQNQIQKPQYQPQFNESPKSIEKFVSKQLINKKLDEAIEIIEKNNLPYRVARIDGEEVLGTKNYISDRINLVVVKNRIASTYLG